MMPPTKFQIMRANRSVVREFRNRLRILEATRESLPHTLSAKDMANLIVIDDMRKLMDKTLGIPPERQRMKSRHWPVCEVCGGDLTWTKGGTQGHCFVHGKQSGLVWP